MNLSLDNLVIDSDLNPHYDAPCPGCGRDDGVSRNCWIGVAVKDGPRICGDCLDALVPDLSKALDLVTDLEWLLTEDAEDPALLALASRSLMNMAVQRLLFDVDWQDVRSQRESESEPA